MLSSPCISVCKSGITEIESEDCETDNANLVHLKGIVCQKDLLIFEVSVAYNCPLLVLIMSSVRPVY